MSIQQHLGVNRHSSKSKINVMQVEVLKMSAVGTDIVDSIFMVKFSLNKVEMYQQLLFYLAKILARPIHHHGPEWPRWGVANYVCTRIHINQ